MVVASITVLGGCSQEEKALCDALDRIHNDGPGWRKALDWLRENKATTSPKHYTASQLRQDFMQVSAFDNLRDPKDFTKVLNDKEKAQAWLKAFRGRSGTVDEIAKLLDVHPIEVIYTQRVMTSSRDGSRYFSSDDDWYRGTSGCE